MVEITEKEYQTLVRQLESFKNTQKKYREKNKEYYKEYHRKWQQDNRERISQYQKQWRLKKKQIDLWNSCDNLETKGEMQ